MKKLFGEINLTWKKLIVFSVLAGVYTAVMTLIPATKDTSFRDIAISFECWILFGIIIICNSKSPLDSALKCFIFFLISQPLVYLIQVPFSSIGWRLFVYYKYWFSCLSSLLDCELSWARSVLSLSVSSINGCLISVC